MFRANQNRILERIIQHAATMSFVLNTQDSILIIKSLQTLQIRTRDVKRICEKASISIAANPTEANATVIVDTVNALTSLQASNIKAVHNVLVKRFLELGGTHSPSSNTAAVTAEGAAPPPRSVHPKTVQKAAVTLLKLGRKNVRADVADHVFCLIVNSLRENADDAGLHLALLSTFCLLSKKWYELSLDSRNALFDACVFLFGGSNDTSPCFAASLKGNRTWQAMHFYVLYAQVALNETSELRKSDELDGFFVEETEGVTHLEAGADSMSSDEIAQQRTVWLASFYTFTQKKALHVQSMSAGSYATFLSDNLKALWPHSPTRRETLAPLQDHAFFARFNTYDVAKVSMALCNVLERHPVADSAEAHGEAKPGALGSDLQVLHVVFNSIVRIEKLLQQDAKLVKGRAVSAGDAFLLTRHGTSLGSTWQLFQAVADVAASAAEEGEPEWREKLDKIVRRLCRTTLFFLSCTEPDASLTSWLFNSVAKAARTGACVNELDELIQFLFKKHIQLLGTSSDAMRSSDGHLLRLSEHVKNLLSYTFLCTLSPLELHTPKSPHDYLASLARRRTATYSFDSVMASTLLDNVIDSLKLCRINGDKSVKMLADTCGIYLKELAGTTTPQTAGSPFDHKLTQLTLSFLDIAAKSASEMSTSTLLSLVLCGLALMGVPGSALPDKVASDNVSSQLLEWLTLLQKRDVNFMQWSRLLFRLDAVNSSLDSKHVSRQTVKLYDCIVKGSCDASAAANFSDSQQPDYISPKQWLHAAEVVRRRGGVLCMNREAFLLATGEKRTATGSVSNLFLVDVEAFLKSDVVADEVASAHLLRLIGEDFKAKSTLPTKRMHIRSLVQGCLYGADEMKEASPRLCSVHCLVYMLNCSTFLLRNNFLSSEQQQQMLESVLTHLQEAQSGDCQASKETRVKVSRKATVQLIGALCEAQVFWRNAKLNCDETLVCSVKKTAVAIGFSMTDSVELEEQMCALKVNVL